MSTLMLIIALPIDELTNCNLSDVYLELAHVDERGAEYLLRLGDGRFGRVYFTSR